MLCMIKSNPRHPLSRLLPLLYLPAHDTRGALVAQRHSFLLLRSWLPVSALFYNQVAGFLAGGVLDCNLAHRRSAAELFMLFKINSNPMHPLSSALPLPYVPECVTHHGALVAHIIIIIIKRGWQCKAGRERLTPYHNPKTPTLQHQPIERKKRKGKQ